MLIVSQLGNKRMIMFNEPDYTWEAGISRLLATGTLTVLMLSVNVLVRCERMFAA